MKPLSLGLLRSDLMLDSGICSETCVEGQITSPYCCFKQVEINTIASGFGWMGPASGMIHRSVIPVPGGHFFVNTVDMSPYIRKIHFFTVGFLFIQALNFSPDFLPMTFLGRSFFCFTFSVSIPLTLPKSELIVILFGTILNTFSSPSSNML